MRHRFFCENLPESGSVCLVEPESHHLTHVLRHQSDDVIEVFRGDGLVATCRIGAIRKRDVELEVIESRRAPLPAQSLTLATAVPKGDRFDWLVEKATELGVTRLIPLTTARSSVDPRSTKLDKLRQTVITACKQSGRNHLMSISQVTSWGTLLSVSDSDRLLLVADPRGASIDETLSAAKPTRQIVIAIGPEGGFLDTEVQQAIDAGAKRITLGSNLLRIETAAIAVAARLLV